VDQLQERYLNFLLLPVDLAKKRMQLQAVETAEIYRNAQDRFRGAWHAMKTLAVRDGVVSLFRGGTVSILKSTVAGGVIFGVNEELRQLLKRSKQ